MISTCNSSDSAGEMGGETGETLETHRPASLVYTAE